MLVFSGRSNPALAENIAAQIGEPLGACEIKTFCDGEIWVKYRENIRGRDVFIIQSTTPPAENLLELLILYWFGRDVFWRLGRKGFWRLIVIASVSAAVVAVVIGLIMAAVGAPDGWNGSSRSKTR